MYVNAFLLGVLATLFVEMAILIFAYIVAPRLYGRHASKDKVQTKTRKTQMEVK